MFTQAVVAMFEVLLLFAKAEELIKGFLVNVVTPFKVVVDVPVPSATDPPDKFAPIVSAELSLVP